MTTKDFDGYAVHGDFYQNGECKLAVLSHLDTVPAGEGWSYPPFKLTKADGKLFGRGTIDDKGPSVAVLWAVKAIKELNIPIKKNFRVIFGGNEEGGCEDMEYYESKQPFPEMVFTPDGSFPVLNCEKGMVHLTFSAEFSDDKIAEINGGSVINAIPDKCIVKFADDCEKVIRGKSSHGSRPENGDTEAKKAALFSKVRSGDVRVLLGSTAKMGAGTNVQSRLVAVHHLDVGWKPSDMTQRNGRIIRQGNMNKEVKVFNYVTEGTFDAYLWQTLENKQRFISQIMTSKSPVRSCEDVDEQALSYAEIKALCAGNPLIKEKMDLDVQVAKLKVLKADHQSQKFRLQDKLLTKFPADIQETNAHIAGLKADAQLAAAHLQGKEEFCGMTIKGVTYDEKKTAGERLVLACSELPNAEEKVIGSYRGFELSLRFDTFRSEYQAILKGQRRYPVALGTDPLGNIIRLDNSLNNFPERINSAENELATLHQQQAAAQIEVEKPFPQEEELTEKSARLAELNAQLDVDEKSHEPEQDEEEHENVSRRPSVLAALEEKSDKPEPVKPFRSYYGKDGDAR